MASASIDGSVTAYSFDAAGNLDGIKRGASATSTLAYDSGNRLTAAGTTNFGWDTAHGWRTSARRSAESSVAMSYTGTGRLSTYSDPNRSLTATYAYDAAGQRTTSHVSAGTRSTDTTWTYDGIQLLGLQSSETSGSTESSWTITYFRDEGGTPYGGVYTATGASATPFLMVATDRGDVVELTDASGSPFATYRYDAFGNPIVAATATRATAALPATLTAAIATRQPLRYAGYCYDAESATYYLSARTYDPATGQFLTKDPARADSEESAYQYCGGDPVGKVDPSGLWSWSVMIRVTDFFNPINYVPLGLEAKFATWIGGKAPWMAKWMVKWFAAKAESKVKSLATKDYRQVKPSFLELRKNAIGWWWMGAWTQSRSLHFASQMWQEPINSKGKWRFYGYWSSKVAAW